MARGHLRGVSRMAARKVIACHCGVLSFGLKLMGKTFPDWVFELELSHGSLFFRGTPFDNYILVPAIFWQSYRMMVMLHHLSHRRLIMPWNRKMVLTPGPWIMRFSLLQFSLMRFFKTFQNDLVNAIFLHECDLSVEKTSIVRFFFTTANLYEVFNTIYRSYIHVV